MALATSTHFAGFLFSLILLNIVSRAVAVELPRGVSPADASLYVPLEGKFHCLDGLRTVAFSRVNDDYCDCYDGSDEPGTSACKNGKFFCQNIGHEPRLINASFVDDSVCDCCDGSDEKSGQCPNNCKEKGMQALQGMQERLHDVKTGLKAKRKLETAATTTRKAWESRFEQLESLESGKAEQKASAEVKKEQASSKLDRLREKLGKIEEKLRQLREKERMAEKNASIGEGGDVSDPSPDDTMDTNQPVSSPEDGTNSDDYIPVNMPTPVGSAEEGDETREETEEERAKRIASQWIPGANHEDGEENQDEEAPSDNDEPYEDENAMQEGSADYEFEHGEPVVPDEPGVPQPDDHYPEGSPHVELNFFQKFKFWIASKLGRMRGSSELEQEKNALDEQIKIAQKAYDDANDAYIKKLGDYTELTSEKKSLTKKLSLDYGPNDIYIPLSEACVEGFWDKYTYKLCPYGDATQKEGSHSTTLGSWSGFEGLVMKFDNGQTCWQGPARSIHVDVECGATDTLEKVVEPSRCAYKALLKTPAACSDSLVAELQAEIDRKVKLLHRKDEL